MLTTERNEVYCIHRLPRTWDYNRVYRFPPRRVGYPENGSFQDRWVLVEDFFDLGTVDVLTTGDDHVLGTINEENVALGIHTTEIAAVIPPVTQGVGGLFGFVPVALHDIRATHDDFAN